MKKKKKLVAVFLLVISFLIVPFKTVYAEQISGETGETLTKEQADEIVNYIIEKIASGALDSEEAVRAAIAEAEEELQITLTEEDKEGILKVVNTINSWELDAEGLAEKAKEVYEKYGTDLFENPEQIMKEVAKDSADGFWKGIGTFFVDLGKDIKGFFQNGVQKIFDFF